MLHEFDEVVNVMDALRLIIMNSLAKLLPGQDPDDDCLLPAGDWSALRGERTAIQAAVRWQWQPAARQNRALARLRIESPLAGLITVSRIVTVPVRLPVYPVHDDNILTDQPGLIPDLLQEMVVYSDGRGDYWLLRLPHRQWQSFWIEFAIPAGWPAGTYPLTLRVETDNDNLVCLGQADLTVIAADLPEQALLHTEWFHADCLADTYRTPVFSEDWWQIVGNFMRMASDHGVNLLLTPIFTPPLDTAEGGERTTVQLVDVQKTADGWQFDFARLKRWIDLAFSCAISRFEMAHLFTQWGAKAAPKIMATVDGVPERVFGWDTPADGPAYRSFLAAFLPRLVEQLDAWGLAGRCYFHISDEPSLQALDSYRQARDQVAAHVGDYPIIDALSDFAFYQTGAVSKPVPASNHIEPFLQAQLPDLWTYYCCSQHIGVSNRFMAMPSARNRIIGIQLYLFQIEGFLHWGFNFYNNQYSLNPINPYLVNDADGAFPAGDAFLVYPGPDGRPEASLRLKVFHQALCDLRALQLLEKKTSRRQVVDLIQAHLDEPLTFTQYPHDAAWLIRLRRDINEAIAACG